MYISSAIYFHLGFSAHSINQKVSFGEKSIQEVIFCTACSAKEERISWKVSL